MVDNITRPRPPLWYRRIYEKLRWHWRHRNPTVAFASGEDDQGGIAVDWGDDHKRYDACEHLSFVAHEGKKRFQVPLYLGTRDSWQFVVYRTRERISIDLKFKVLSLKADGNDAIIVLKIGEEELNQCLQLGDPFT